MNDNAASSRYYTMHRDWYIYVNMLLQIALYAQIDLFRYAARGGHSLTEYVC